MTVLVWKASRHLSAIRSRVSRSAVRLPPCSGIPASSFQMAASSRMGARVLSGYSSITGVSGIMKVNQDR